MKPVTSLALSIILFSATSAHAMEQSLKPGNVMVIDSKKVDAIINKKCISCHSKEKIDTAISSGKDMNSIQKEMEKRGAKLDSNEREVLGIFWKKSKPTSK